VLICPAEILVVSVRVKFSKADSTLMASFAKVFEGRVNEAMYLNLYLLSSFSHGFHNCHYTLFTIKRLCSIHMAGEILDQTSMKIFLRGGSPHYWGRE
jgi:hypothetical protein